MTEDEKREKGLWFTPSDAELKAQKLKAHDLNLAYNVLSESEVEKRNEILSNLLGYFGKNVFLQGPITFHYGIHTFIGDNTFINFNFTAQDDGNITIGKNCNFGPNVTLVTPVHPLIASERNSFLCPDNKERRLCRALPIKIGDNCWFGANVTVVGGVTIGENCVIGAGAVVTKDIPSNSLAYGVPCRVVREITEQDSIKNHPEYFGD